DVGRVDGDAVRHLRDPGVAGSAVDLVHERALPDLPDERVLPTAVSDDQDSHALGVCCSEFNLAGNTDMASCGRQPHDARLVIRATGRARPHSDGPRSGTTRPRLRGL